MHRCDLVASFEERLSIPVSTYRLEALLAPKSIAVVGASPREGSLGRIALRNLRQGGFAGPIHLVNPRHPEIDGVKAVASLDAIAQAPDVLVITAPEVPAIVAAAGARGWLRPSSSAPALAMAPARLRRSRLRPICLPSLGVLPSVTGPTFDCGGAAIASFSCSTSSLSKAVSRPLARGS